MSYDIYRDVVLRCEQTRSERIAADRRRGQFAAAVSRLLRPRAASAARPAAARRANVSQYSGG